VADIGDGHLIADRFLDTRLARAVVSRGAIGRAGSALRKTGLLRQVRHIAI
jgi:hypothetical protein